MEFSTIFVLNRLIAIFESVSTIIMPDFLNVFECFRNQKLTEFNGDQQSYSTAKQSIKWQHLSKYLESNLIYCGNGLFSAFEVDTDFLRSLPSIYIYIFSLTCLSASDLLDSVQERTHCRTRIDRIQMVRQHLLITFATVNTVELSILRIRCLLNPTAYCFRTICISHRHCHL